jgi:hypothetical protein
MVKSFSLPLNMLAEFDLTAQPNQSSQAMAVQWSSGGASRMTWQIFFVVY